MKLTEFNELLSEFAVALIGFCGEFKTEEEIKAFLFDYFISEVENA